MLKFALAVSVILLSPLAVAEWQLDTQHSSVSFVSIKAGNIAEAHQFNELSGSISADHLARVQINTASVDTLIPIRDDRMREFLFETVLFPSISVQAQLDAASMALTDTPRQQDINVKLTIKDTNIETQAQVLITSLSASRVLVTTVKPVLINASAVGLTQGVEKLRELAGLPSISQAVPVIFTLIFERS